MPQHQKQHSEKSSTRVKEAVKPPALYHVIFHNDDVTTMDFVVMLLVTVFNKTRDDAVALMLRVHHRGRAVVGTYSLDMAKTKTQKALQMSRDAGFPLRITYEQE